VLLVLLAGTEKYFKKLSKKFAEALGELITKPVAAPKTKTNAIVINNLFLIIVYIFILI